MTEPHRRPRRAAAVVGLLAGLALLLGAVVDGGMASPTRSDEGRAVAAVPHGDVVAAPTATPREARAAWSAPLLPRSSGVAAVAALALVALVLVVGERHRTPARRAARHRGPPALV